MKNESNSKKKKQYLMLRKNRIIVIFIVIFLSIIGGNVIWKIYQNKQINANFSNKLDKRELAKQIKADLENDLKLIENSDYLVSFLIEVRDRSDGVIYFPVRYSYDKNTIQPEELELEDYQEIVRLILYNRKRNKEKEEKRQQVINEKTKNNEKLFCYRMQVFTFSDERFYRFEGRKNGLVYKLKIPIKHPDITNNFPSDKPNDDKVGKIYLIDGLGEPDKEEGVLGLFPSSFSKDINLTDKISMTRIED